MNRRDWILLLILLIICALWGYHTFQAFAHDAAGCGSLGVKCLTQT